MIKTSTAEAQRTQRKRTIYIASSWRNKYAVELLTERLRNLGCEVKSFIENAADVEHSMPFEKWINDEDADEKFKFDVDSAMNCDLLIYIGPSGIDAWAEVGAAYGRAVPIWGLWSKGEQVGLMRKMVLMWFHQVDDLCNTLVKLEAFKEFV